MALPRKSTEKMTVPTVCMGLNMETMTGPFFSSAHVWNMMHAELTTPPCTTAGHRTSENRSFQLNHGRRFCNVISGSTKNTRERTI